MDACTEYSDECSCAECEQQRADDEREYWELSREYERMTR